MDIYSPTPVSYKESGNMPACDHNPVPAYKESGNMPACEPNPIGSPEKAGEVAPWNQRRPK